MFPGLDLEREILACHAQRLGDTVLVHDDARLAGAAICHCGAGSEAGSGDCFVKFGAVRPGDGGAFERLLDACEAFAAAAGLERIVAGVNTGRLDGIAACCNAASGRTGSDCPCCCTPSAPGYDGPDDYAIDDLR